MRDDPTRRRACLLGLAMLIPTPAAAAAVGTRRHPPRAAPARAAKHAPPRSRVPVENTRKQAATARVVAPPPSPAASRQPQRQTDGQLPPSRAPAGDAQRLTATGHGAAQSWPQIDGPPPPSRRPGLEPAPVPNGNVLPPVGERGRVGPSVSFGVPTPPVLIEGQSFRANDSAPQERQQQQQGGLRLPSPGATVRLPF